MPVEGDSYRHNEPDQFQFHPILLGSCKGRPASATKQTTTCHGRYRDGRRTSSQKGHDFGPFTIGLLHWSQRSLTPTVTGRDGTIYPIWRGFCVSSTRWVRAAFNFSSLSSSSSISRRSSRISSRKRPKRLM